jgi:hypothetical protein
MTRMLSKSSMIRIALRDRSGGGRLVRLMLLTAAAD